MEWMFIFFILCSIIAIFFIFLGRKVDNEFRVEQILNTYKEEVKKQKELLLKQEKEINRIEKKIALKRKK